MKANKLKKAAGIALCGIMLLGIAACGKDAPPIEDIVDDYDTQPHTALDADEIKYQAATYDEHNTYFNYIELYDDKGEIYQIGDPYVMRYNGKYYLYSSVTTGHLSHGIPCWVSDNMIDWEFSNWVYGDGTAGSAGTIAYTAYAPEVVFYRGYFYLCEKPVDESGRSTPGHYILRSTSPNGKFEPVSNDLGEGIDGTFWVDAEDNLYLVSATTGNALGSTITYVPLLFDGEGRVTKGNRVIIETASLNGWTEGPGIFERDGYKYLTYTGNSVDSSCYRVGYSYTANALPFRDLKTEENKIILVNTGDDTPYEGGGYGSGSGYKAVSTYRGLGHSSNVYGPNLDSVFIAYHNAGRRDHTGVNGSGYNRRYNVAQMFTNQGKLSVNGLCITPTPKPAMPVFTSEGDERLALSGDDAWKLSEQASGAVFTAEINFKLRAGRGSAVVGYGSDGFTEIAVDGTTLTVRRGTEVLGSATVAASDYADALHTVRVINGAGKSEIWYDNVKRIALDRPVSAGGKVGVGKDTETGYVQFSDDAFGTGDFESVKNLGATFPAYTYLKQENRGWQLSQAQIRTDGVRQGEKESTAASGSDGGVATVLHAGDWVKYAVNAPEASRYALDLTLSKESANCIFEVIIDERSVYKMKVSDAVFPESGYVPVHTGTFPVEAGVHSMKIRVYKGTLNMTQIATAKDAQRLDDFDAPLTADFAQGTPVIGCDSVAFSTNNGLVTNADEPRTLYYFGAKGLANYEISVDVTVKSGTAGILFRAKNFCYDEIAGTPKRAFQGYLLEMNANSVALYKENFFETRLASEVPLVDGQRAFAGSRTNRVTVRVLQNKFVVLLNDVQILEAVDNNAFMDGYCGLFSDSSRVQYKDLSFKKL